MSEPVITDHPYEGLPDGKYCSHDSGDLDLVDLCTMPRSAHSEGDTDE